MSIRTGAEFIQGLRDGRVVYLGNEWIDDVTTHPAFRNAVRTVARLYDMKADPAHRETMTCEEDGDRHSIYYLRPQTRDDLHEQPCPDRACHGEIRLWTWCVA